MGSNSSFDCFGTSLKFSSLNLMGFSPFTTKYDGRNLIIKAVGAEATLVGFLPNIKRGDGGILTTEIEATLVRTTNTRDDAMINIIFFVKK
jgi:hypothetical protein